VDLELTASAQLGLIRVGKGQTEAGFALIDEAMAAALAGERLTFDTVVFACCDMLSACELASDIERAAQWCAVASDFVSRYGCPFLYAECRIYYGSVLAALRFRQGRLEEADGLLADMGGGIEAEAEAPLLAAVVSLARGDGVAVADLEAALNVWSSLELPLEVARTRFELARALAAGEFDTAVEHARLALAGSVPGGNSREHPVVLRDERAALAQQDRGEARSSPEGQ
jgi:hypothetical protein